MKKVTIVKSNEVEVKSFILNEFIQTEAKNSTMRKITKKELGRVADRLKLNYSDKEINFAKKLIQQLCK